MSGSLAGGAGRFSTEGMSQLIEAGEDTTQDYGQLHAPIKAGADRADAEEMAYGATGGCPRPDRPQLRAARRRRPRVTTPSVASPRG